MYKTISKYNYSYDTTTYYELNHVIRKYLDGGATEADGRASAQVSLSVATPLVTCNYSGLHIFTPGYY